MYRALDGLRFEFACIATTHSDFYQSLGSLHMHVVVHRCTFAALILILLHLMMSIIVVERSAHRYIDKAYYTASSFPRSLFSVS